MARRLYLISYDITNDRARTRLAHLLEEYGQRVQYSVFEVWLSEVELARLRSRLAFVVEEEGSVRLYGLCAACQKRVEVLGRGSLTKELGLLII